MSNVVDEPVVKVTFPRTGVEELTEMRARLDGPGLAAADDAELAVAFDNEVAKYVETMLRILSTYDDFTFEPSFGDVEYPEVSLDGVFPEDVGVSFRYPGEEQPTKRRLTLPVLSALVSTFWMDTLDDEMVAENVSDALHAMGLDGSVTMLGDAE